MEVLIVVGIIFLVGLISSFTNNKKEQFQLLKGLVLPAGLIVSFFLLNDLEDIFPSTGTVFDVLIKGTSISTGTMFDLVIFAISFLISVLISVLMLVASFFLGMWIASLILFFAKRRGGEKPDSEEY